MCRTPIPSVKQLLVIGDTDPNQEDEVKDNVGGLPAKGVALLQLIANSPVEQRFLVFSAHEASFKGLREVLAARDIRCEMLQGSAARVERLRAQFRDGSIRVLCMNARHVGAGINLEAATHVVLYHRMNVRGVVQKFCTTLAERSYDSPRSHFGSDSKWTGPSLAATKFVRYGRSSTALARRSFA
jgi:hypothetical protein